MIYWILASIVFIIFLLFVYALCKIADAADKEEEYLSDNL